MKKTFLLTMLLCAAVAASGQARKSCEDLKAEIAKKLDDKGVASYTLDIVEKDRATEGKVVGTCDGGTKQIVYSRSAASKPAMKASSKTEAKPEVKPEAKPDAAKPKS